jgi:cytochrome oxidase Cu insertion factor (SCO1/SenC/PrrC family)
MRTSGVCGRRIAVAATWIGLLAGCSRNAAPLPSFALELRGRAVIISFIFTSCHEVCPLVTAHLARAQAEVRSAGLSSTVRFVSITVDPSIDTPDVLRGYAARFGADTATWDFLTGSPEEVSRVMRAMRVFAANDRGRLGHEPVVLFVNPLGEIVRRYTDVDHLSAQILDQVRRLRPRQVG